MPDAEDPFVVLEASTLRAGKGEARVERRAVAVEVAVNVVYGTVPYAVMMMTPRDLEDFVVGFSLTEGIVTGREDVRGIAVEQAAGGMRVVVDLVPARFHGLLARRRAMNGRTSCGVCGIEELSALPRAELRAGGHQLGGDRVGIGAGAVWRALAMLPGLQGLNDETRAVHAAGWAGLDGTVSFVREDVGRHNALDKLIGALLTAGVNAADGFVVVTSRCSYEMVEKAAAFGVAVLVAISAPTSMGVERAEHHGMTLVGIARADAMTVFTGAGRILLEEGSGSGK